MPATVIDYCGIALSEHASAAAIVVVRLMPSRRERDWKRESDHEHVHEDHGEIPVSADFVMHDNRKIRPLHESA